MSAESEKSKKERNYSDLGRKQSQVHATLYELNTSKNDLFPWAEYE
jgi:hypothetical protein